MSGIIFDSMQEVVDRRSSVVDSDDCMMGLIQSPMPITFLFIHVPIRSSLSKEARKAARPIRPNPLIPTRQGGKKSLEYAPAKDWSLLIFVV